MNYFGIDVGKKQHAVAAASQDGGLLWKKARTFGQNAEGYAQLVEWLGDPKQALVGLEATGHYWKNLVAMLVTEGYPVVLINPLRTKRYAEEEMMRAKTDSVDAKSIARLLAEKQPTPTRVPDAVTTSLLELVRLRDRLVQDLGDRKRQLLRALDLAFPEFPDLVGDIASARSTAMLKEHPTADAFAQTRTGVLAELVYDGRHKIGRPLAQKVIAAARTSIGAHTDAPYALQVQFFCEDIEAFAARIADLDKRIHKAVDGNEIAKLLTTIDGIGTNTSARLIAKLGNPADFDSPKALAAFVGVAPATNHSGQRRPLRSPVSGLGDAELRRMLWMPTQAAVRFNPVLKRFYERLIAAGKPKKLAMIAAMRKLLAIVYAVASRRTPFTKEMPLAA